MAAWTQADLDTLDAAIAGGAVLSAMTFGETTLTFRTLDDMLKLRALMMQALAAAAGTAGATRYAGHSKGC